MGAVHKKYEKQVIFFKRDFYSLLVFKVGGQIPYLRFIPCEIQYGNKMHPDEFRRVLWICMCLCLIPGSSGH